MAPPSADPACPLPHATGGAIDLSVLDERRALVEMGTAFDAFDARAHTRYLERRLEAGEHLTAAEQAYLRNRRVLFHALRGAGFTNYPEEWWHFDFGNQLHARIEGTHAVFGQAAPAGYGSLQPGERSAAGRPAGRGGGYETRIHDTPPQGNVPR